jgi:hypothetical protein
MYKIESVKSIGIPEFFIATLSEVLIVDKLDNIKGQISYDDNNYEILGVAVQDFEQEKRRVNYLLLKQINKI